MTEEIVVRLRSSVFSWRIASRFLLLLMSWLLADLTINLLSEDL